MHRVRKNKFIFGGISVLVVIVAVVVSSEALRDAYEISALALFPSAARAAAYGEEHFNAQHAARYNIGLAEYFYTQAARLDSSYPYVYHQLARIAFLRGDFATAMFFIDPQIRLHGDSEPNSYYIRGLIEGYMGRYDDAVVDYEHFLQFHPHDWAAINDYAWVLLKAGRPEDAARITTDALKMYAGNPWLLNSNAIALYETHNLVAARTSAAAALRASSSITESEWLTAYPGNDPNVAREGLATFRQAAFDNMNTIDRALAARVVP